MLLVHKWRHGDAGPITVCTGARVEGEARDSPEHSYAWRGVTCPACLDGAPKYALLRQMGVEA